MAVLMVNVAIDQWGLQGEVIKVFYSCNMANYNEIRSQNQQESESCWPK